MGRAPRSRVRARGRAHGAAPRASTSVRCACRRRSIPRAPEVCQAIIVHPPGGIVGGDSLAIAIDAGGWRARAAHYARRGEVVSLRRGASRESVTTLRVACRRRRSSGCRRRRSCSTARGRRSRSAVELAPESRFIGWDMTCLGRTASGERFASGSLRQSLELVRDGALLFCERAAIDGGGRALQSGAMLNGRARFWHTRRRGRAGHGRPACGVPRSPVQDGRRRGHAPAGSARRALSRRLGKRGAHIFCYAVASAAPVRSRAATPSTPRIWST